MALMYSNGMAIGTSAPPFSLPATDGERYDLGSFADAELLLVVFTCNHCPYAKAVEDRLVALQADYRDKGLAIVAINPNDASRYPADSFDAMKARAAEKGFNFPYLYDESQEVARAYDAACTPDLFLFDRERALRYNGRLDDNWQEARKVTRHELREAIDALLEGRAIEGEIHPAMGCSIKWKS